VWDNIQLRKDPVGQDRMEIGQDRNNASCPNENDLLISNNRSELPLGQDDFSFVGNIKENNVNEDKNIETVSGDKSDDFLQQPTCRNHPVLLNDFSIAGL
jgi:hypothetical protein